MFKNVIAPIQAWLLSQGKCVGCGKLLEKVKDKGFTRVDCNCGRMYMYDHDTDKFRRAHLDEIR